MFIPINKNGYNVFSDENPSPSSKQADDPPKMPPRNQMRLKSGKQESSLSLSKEKEEKSSNCQAGVNFFKSLVGISLLAFPYPFQSTGVILAPILSIIFTSISYYCIKILVEVSENISTITNSLSELAFTLLGRAGCIYSGLVVVFSQIGGTLAYASFFHMFLQKMFCNVHLSFFCENDILLYLLLFLFVLPLSFISKISKFNKFSLVANLTILVSIGFVL